MNLPHSDALVFFGATGDLIFKKVFPSLYAMEQRGHLKVPVIGVARSDWTRRRSSWEQQDDEWLKRFVSHPAQSDISNDNCEINIPITPSVGATKQRRNAARPESNRVEMKTPSHSTAARRRSGLMEEPHIKRQENHTGGGMSRAHLSGRWA